MLMNHLKSELFEPIYILALAEYIRNQVNFFLPIHQRFLLLTKLYLHHMIPDMFHIHIYHTLFLRYNMVFLILFCIELLYQESIRNLCHTFALPLMAVNPRHQWNIRLDKMEANFGFLSFHIVDINNKNYNKPYLYFKLFYYAFVTVQPDGIPFSPVGQLDIDDAFTNVPDDETSSSQTLVQSVADILVARHFI